LVGLEKGEKCIVDIDGKTVGRRSVGKSGGRLVDNIKKNLRWDERVWTEFISVRRGSDESFCEICYKHFCFIKCWGNS
jgi:hypothetical protein